MRAFKTVNDSYIEPVSFIVPRRAEVFQGDIYPPCVGLKPGMSSAEYFAGKEATPPKFSLEATYEGEAPVEVPAEALPKPSSAPAPKPEPKQEPKPEPIPEPTPVAARGPPPSVNDNKTSMASAAAKFADKDEPESSSTDEASSFEEIPKPAERPNVTARMEEKTRGPEVSHAPEPTPEETPAATPPAREERRSVSGAASAAAAGIKDQLAEIKQMLSSQNQAMTSQMQQMAHLTAEVNNMKHRLVELERGGEKDERIRQLELELEEARS